MRSVIQSGLNLLAPQDEVAQQMPCQATARQPEPLGAETGAGRQPAEDGGFDGAAAGPSRAHRRSCAPSQQRASSASEVANGDGTAMGAVVGTMQQVSASSHRNGEIISTIDCIPIKTIILTLDTAVEAGRTGRGGAGARPRSGGRRVY